MNLASTPIGNDLTKNLNFSETTTFLYILNKVIDDLIVTRSNKEISQDLKLSVSTVEKHLKKLDSLGLIKRNSVRSRNPFSLEWETVSRTIKIPDNVLDPQVLAVMHSQRIHSMLELIITPESTKEFIKQAKESRTSNIAKSN